MLRLYLVFSINLIVVLLSACGKPATGKITIDTRPSGAQVLVGEQVCQPSPCTLEVAPGEYRVEAVLDNYEKARTEVSVNAGEVGYKTIRLIPLEPTPDEAKRLHLKEPPPLAGDPKPPAPKR